MSLMRAQSVDDHLEWFRQAVFEAADLRHCLKSNSDDMARFPAFLDPLPEGVQAICAA